MPETDDLWDAWYMAYPATLVMFGLPYVICFILALLPIYIGWLDPDTFWPVAMTVLKYGVALCGIIGSLWALKDYHVAEYH